MVTGLAMGLGRGPKGPGGPGGTALLTVNKRKRLANEEVI